MKPIAKPWQDLIDKGEPEPTEEQQKEANNKNHRNLKNKNNKEPLSLFKKWAYSLYQKNKRASFKAKIEAGTNSNVKP